MENPEEVLQALDEFQKMRPSEIPRELEEYLSWVAKTGDPVYQWSLVKPLFREKLTRVMTDFYESCPSLELAPCPNVEQFNYDFMKCNLLELLESFANAPFTVQRICELLTAPRKEYNRVDKFMRAIEKNILVVSTVEPGPAARRSENGAEGMVNGTSDEEATASAAGVVQSSRDAETETWPKECADVVPAVGKQLAKTNEETSQIRSKSEEPPRLDDNETSRLENPESGVSTTEVAVMNEDTNSQPALDSEVESCESPASRKLQTTFRPKDFARKDEEEEAEEATAAAAAETREEAKTDKSRVKADEGEAVKSEEPRSGAEKTSFQCRNPDAPSVDDLPEKRARIDRLIDDLESVESIVDDEVAPPKKESIAERTEEGEILPEEAPRSPKVTENKVETTTSDEPRAAEEPKIDEPEATVETTKKDAIAETSEDNESSSACHDNNPKPIVEEPISEETETRKIDETAAQQQEEASGVTIEEAMDDDTRVNNKSIVPDPIPIVEEPKESEPSTRNAENTTVIEEIPEVTGEPEVTAETPCVNETPVSVARLIDTEANVEEDITTVRDNREDITDVRCPEITSVESKIEPAESMEVDGEEFPTFQQDEPMEQEAGDLVKS